MERKILETKDYAMFKSLEGNRDALITRVNKIVASINDVGYIPAPIVVNERMEVIDGAGRLAACKQLDIPIAYVVIEGLGIKECRRMNLNQENWTTKDFIRSYALDNENYRRLAEIVADYPQVSLKVLCAVINKAVTKNMTASPWIPKTLAEGMFVYPFEHDLEIVAELDWITSFDISKVSNATIFMYALSYLYHHPRVNNDVFAEKFKNNRSRLEPFSNAVECLRTLSDIANLYSRRRKVYLADDFIREKDHSDLPDA